MRFANIWLWYSVLACHTVPEGLDDVEGHSGPTLVGVGLPGEGDCAPGHLRHHRPLGRPWQLDGL
jgi:hypothetical protein